MSENTELAPDDTAPPTEPDEAAQTGEAAPDADDTAQVAVRGSVLTVPPDATFFTSVQVRALMNLGVKMHPQALINLGIDPAGYSDRQVAENGAQLVDLGVLFHAAQRSGLDPFARQLHLVPRDGKYGVQTGIDGFRVVATRSGLYAGQVGPQWCGPDGMWADVWIGSTAPSAARLGILRKDFDEPVWGVAVFREYAVTKSGGVLTAMWEKMPSLMLAKCAEANALRKAFPQDLSGIYTPDESGAFDVVDGEIVERAVDPGVALERRSRRRRAAGRIESVETLRSLSAILEDAELLASDFATTVESLSANWTAAHGKALTDASPAEAEFWLTSTRAKLAKMDAARSAS